MFSKLSKMCIKNGLYIPYLCEEMNKYIELTLEPAHLESRIFAEKKCGFLKKIFFLQNLKSYSL